MKALTVQQPWAWAIIHGGKDVENRTWPTPHRGPLLIHAGQREQPGEWPRVLLRAVMQADMLGPRPRDDVRGAIIGAVDLVDVHLARPGCCPSEWGEQPGQDQRDLLHWELANPRPLEQPIRCRGKQQLWTPPYEVAYPVHQQLGSGA